MRIHQVHLRDYKGVSDCEVRFAESGVTIVEGDNEVGKTSIMEAVDLLLGYRDDSSAQPVRSSKPVDRDVGTEVSAEISTGSYRFVYRKRWHKGKETELRILEPRAEQLTAREAHDRVGEILAETLDEALRRALRVEQGAELSQGNLTDCHALSRALDAAAGGDAADTDDTLWERIVAERERYWTAGGKARVERSELAGRVGATRDEVAELERHLVDLARDAAEVERLTSRLAELAADEQRCVDEVAEHDGAAKAVERATTRVEAVAARHVAAVEEFRRHDETVTRRREAAEALAGLDDEVAALREQLERDRPTVDAAERRRDELAERIALERTAVAERRAELDGAVRDAEHLRHLIEVDQLTERRDRVRAAQEGLVTAEEAIDAARVDDELAEQIQDAHLERERARAVVEAEAVRVSATALADGVDVQIDGDAVRLGPGERHDVGVTDAVSITVPGVVEIAVHAGADGRDRTRELSRASAELDVLLERGGVADHAAARRAADERQEAIRAGDDARRTITQDLRDLTFESLVAKVDRLDAQIASFREERSPTAPLPVDLDAATERTHELQQALDRQERSVASLDAEFATTAEQVTESGRERAAHEAKLEMLTGQVDEARRRLTDARAEADDDELARRLADAAARRDAAERELTEANDELAAADPETVATLLQNATDALGRARRDGAKCRDERQGLVTRVEYAVERGPSGDLDDARTRLDRLEREHERLESRARAAELLFVTFARRRDEARSRYHAPFRERIERLGRLVFASDFAVELADDLSIQRRTLDGRTVGFDLLSTGAKEQLGILSRLACATLVAPDEGAPVVIDDALGWTDPGRIRSMGAALSNASQNCQVIVLTCTPGRYSAVGNATVVRLPS